MGILEFEQFFSTSLWTVLYIPFKCFGKKIELAVKIATGLQVPHWSTCLEGSSHRPSVFIFG